ncbi:MAG TPA: M1 family aminopeptidase [Terriglobales bacterium]|nr:M1 family aminopeptidase [Terriglobales bacterium]
MAKHADVVTVVTSKLWKRLLPLVLVVAVAATAIEAKSAGAFFRQASPASKPAEQLYLQLQSVALDPSRVFEIRQASLDYDQLHITMDHGTIAFTGDVEGQVTGAFFEGDGEVLVIPPDQAERASMTLFTGAAILEDRFETAYFRFNDDTFAQLRPYLRDAANPGDFVTKWNETSRNLAASDALRLFMTFSKNLPPGNGAGTSGGGGEQAQSPDRFLHARLQSARLGIFDLFYDSTSAEQISIGQQKPSEGVNYYNVWAQFAAGSTSRTQAAESIAIQSYEIDAQVTPPTELEATARLRIEVLHGGGRALLFELSRYLKVRAVNSGKQSLEYIQNQALEGTQLARRGNDLVAVVFPEELRQGQKLDLTFTYGGDVLSEAGGGLLYVGARGTWYPNRGMAAGTFDLRFRYPAGWTLLATGKRVTGDDAESPAAQTSAQKFSRWVTDVRIPIAGFNLGKYSKAEAHAGNTLIATYAAAGVERTFPKASEQVILVPRVPPLPQPQQSVTSPQVPLSPARNAQVVADAAARAVRFYTERFGAFPYGTLNLTQMPGPLSQGWPGLIFLSSYSFLTPEERSRLHLSPVDEVLSQQVTAHETAHQWWGDLVFWHGYRDQWMSEGLANYCSLMMLESQNPLGFARVMERYREDLMHKNKNGALLKDAGPVTLGTRLFSSEFPDGYEAISYGRGTWLFHMLRHILDDTPEHGPHSTISANPQQEPFVRALLRVRDRYAGKPITTRELMQALAEDLPPAARYENHRSLDWFYENWVNGTAIPRLELEGVKFTPRERSVQVTGTILQKDAPKSLVTSVPLWAQLAGGKRVFVERVFADGPESAFRLTAPVGTRKLLIDPEQTVLTAR